MGCSHEAWLDQRIEQTRRMIELHEDAILQIGTGAVMSYTLDTGQTRQVVTKQNLTELRNALASFESRLEMLENRRCGGGAVVMKPAW